MSRKNRCSVNKWQNVITFELLAFALLLRIFIRFRVCLSTYNKLVACILAQFIRVSKHLRTKEFTIDCLPRDTITPRVPKAPKRIKTISCYKLANVNSPAVNYIVHVLAMVKCSHTVFYVLTVFCCMAPNCMCLSFPVQVIRIPLYPFMILYLHTWTTIFITLILTIMFVVTAI